MRVSRKQREIGKFEGTEPFEFRQGLPLISGRYPGIDREARRGGFHQIDGVVTVGIDLDAVSSCHLYQFLPRQLQLVILCLRRQKRRAEGSDASTRYSVNDYSRKIFPGIVIKLPRN